jgi:hypothetical protein
MKLSKMSIEQLVDKYAEIGKDQNTALLRDEIAKFNKLFDRKRAVEDELKLRGNDERRVLLALYDHQDPQVRLNAIKATLAVAPERARAALEGLRTSGEYPQSMDAGMCISALEEGVFKPT